MIPQPIVDNWVSWAIQVFVVASVGAVLPLIFRIRHPRSQLAYCHLLLIASLVLPAIQPWQHPIVFTHSMQASTSPAAQPAESAMHVVSPALPWTRIVAWLIVAGMVIRISWTAAGLWMIRRHRVASAPLYPEPDSIRRALVHTGAGALFCVSPEGIGPVTFGFFRPVVLLPASFSALDSEAQCAIACHELLHVRRRDWLVTLIEEIVAALFWFHPAFWWLLAQARLAREQLVDAEVVRMTSARDSYINALLTIAGARPRLDLAPVPLFLRRRHLLQRMRLLVTEASMSRLRLVSSYFGIVAILGGVAAVSFALFPLIGRAEVREVAATERTAQPKEPVATQNQPGYVVNIQPLSYPPEAIQNKIEGTVAVELTFNASGNVIDARVLSGPEELRKSALESALRRNYSISVARTLQVLVDFKLANVHFPPPPPPPPPAPGTTASEPYSPRLERIEISGLPEPDATKLRERLQSLQGQEYSADVRDKIKQALVELVGVGGPISTFLHTADGLDGAVLRINFGPVATIQTPFGTAVTGNVQTPFGTRVGGGDPHVEIHDEKLNPITTVTPVYPPLARQASVQGVVVLEATINPEGNVQNLKVLSGHPLLIQSAINAVKQWRYAPQADTVTTVITAEFLF